MMNRPNRSSETTGPVLEVCLALALCLPVACLTPTALFWPQSLGRTSLGPLDGALRPEVIGIALVACASVLPLALALCVRRGLHPRGAVLYLGAGLCALLGARGASDTFELARAELLLAATFALLWSGAALGELGRRVLARGLVLLSLVLTGGALVAASLGHPAGLSGALGNTGSVSEAALAGAAIGALSFARERGGWSWAGLAACAAFGVHVGCAPVLAGALSLAAALLLGLVWVGPIRKRLALATAVFAAAFLVGFAVGPPTGATASASVPASSGAAPPSIGGGIEVRQRLWTSVSALIAEHPLLGVGAGQFAASFPAYRDPVEIELSSHGRQLWQETEVEHAHADLLQFAAEAGLLGAALLIAFLAIVLLALRRSLIERDARMPFALAAFGLVVNGLARTPLTWNPAAAAIAFTVFGTLLARGAAAPARTATQQRVSRWIGWAALALLASRLPAALELVRHERALHESFTALAAGPDSADDLEAVRLAAEAALEARPDSPLAQTHLARLEALTGASPESVRAHWQALLQRRPASIEGLVQDGVFAIRGGRLDEARARWERVVELDPDHPIARRNLVRVAADLDDPAGIERHGRALLRAGRLPESFVLEVAAAAAARGRTQSVDALIAFVADANAPEVLNALAEREEAAGNEMTAQGLRAAAHRAWASEHAANGAWDRAVRSLRSARSAAAAVLGGPSETFEREYAAAVGRAGRPEEARQILAGLDTAQRPTASEPEIAPWAREALEELESQPR